MHSQSLGQTTARARAAVARAVLCAQHSTTSSGGSSSSLGSPSSDDSLGRGSSPEHPSAERQPSKDHQPHQERSPQVRDQGMGPSNGLQRNLLAQYKSHPEGSRAQAKAAAGTRVTFGRGQPLQPLPEGSPSPFQVSVLAFQHGAWCHFCASYDMTG